MNVAPGSMNRRISHGPAMRSIFGRSRVILENPAIARRVGSPARTQPSIPPSRNWRDPDRTQFNRDLARDFVSVDTVNNNLAVNRQFAQPALQRI